MTFLLFLASVIVLEYLVGGATTPGNKIKDAHTKQVTGEEPITNDTSMADLLALGQALGTEGRSETLDSEQTPKARVT
jgi:hypothetical protein